MKIILTAFAISLCLFVNSVNAAVTFGRVGNDLVMTVSQNIVFHSQVTVTDNDFFGVDLENVYSVAPAELVFARFGPNVAVSIDGLINAASDVSQGPSSGDIAPRDIVFNLRNYPANVTITPGEALTVASGTYTATNYFTDFNAVLPDQPVSTAFF
jgi:ABC-type Na+ efflux pump permease subunit